LLKFVTKCCNTITNAVKSISVLTDSFLMTLKQSGCHGIQTEVDKLHSVTRKRNEQVFGLRLQSQWWMMTLKPLAALWNTTAAETSTVKRTEKENIAININDDPSPAEHCINIYFWKRRTVIKQALHRTKPVWVWLNYAPSQEYTTRDRGKTADNLASLIGSV
jgi:hypothetical protein